MGAQGPAGPVGVAGAPGEAQWVTVPDILFDFDKAVVRQDEMPKIQTVVEKVKANDQLLVRLDGHTDPRGTDSYNGALSIRRVQAVKKALIDAGVPEDRIIIAAFGERRLKCGGPSEECYQIDRRVEVFWGQPGVMPYASPRTQPRSGVTK
jgi:outer membrane protein OmpA-like peptidoglycan-associated protein